MLVWGEWELGGGDFRTGSSGGASFVAAMIRRGKFQGRSSGQGEGLLAIQVMAADKEIQGGISDARRNLGASPRRQGISDRGITMETGMAAGFANCGLAEGGPSLHLGG